MKKIIVTVLAFTAVILSLASCSGGESKEIYSMYDLNKAMSESVTLGDMTYVSSADSDAEDKFEYLSDMDYNKVGAFFMNYAADGAKSADEIAVIAVKSEADADEALSSLKDHLEYRKSLYKTYGPEQIPKLNKALTFSNGRYAVLIVCDNPANAKSAFEKAINS